MKKLKVIFSGIMLLSALCSLTILNGCSNNVTSPIADNVEISIMSAPGLTATQNVSSTLVLDSIKILLKDIKLNVSGVSDTVNFKTGPFVFSLNPNSTVNTVSSLLIPNGSYDKVQFEIHKLEDADIIDTIFSNGGGKYSVVTYGKYNGTSFVYKSSKSAKQKLNFNPPAVVNSVTKSNITLKVQPYTWFWNGSDYMDPTVSSNSNDIDNNIKSSFKAFKDDDHNGIED